MDIDETLKKIEIKARAKVDAGEDKGHNELIKDVRSLLNDTESFQFHDFLNEKFAAPKSVLAKILHQMRDNAINGKYDN